MDVGIDGDALGVFALPQMMGRVVCFCGGLGMCACGCAFLGHGNHDGRGGAVQRDARAGAVRKIAFVPCLVSSHVRCDVWADMHAHPFQRFAFSRVPFVAGWRCFLIWDGILHELHLSSKHSSKLRPWL